MARPKKSLVRRILVQTDCAFWCIHDHLDVLAFLGLPTLGVLVAGALAVVGVWRTWEFSVGINVLAAVFVLPFLALCIFTVLPLPCAVFAWKIAGGERPTAAECFAFCRQRTGRLSWILFRMALLWLGSLLLVWLPIFWVLPKTCLAPLVGLFEDTPKVFRRSGRLLREDYGVSLMGFLYVAMGVVLGGLVVLPRVLLGTPMLGAHILDERWRPAVVDRLWIFETTSVAILLTAIAMSWWVSATFLYHDIRWNREGEYLKSRVATLRGKLAAGWGAQT